MNCRIFIVVYAKTFLFASKTNRNMANAKRAMLLDLSKNKEPFQSTLEFQIWLCEVDKLGNISNYNKAFLFRCYSENYTPESFYFNHVMIPF